MSGTNKTARVLYAALLLLTVMSSLRVYSRALALDDQYNYLSDQEQDSNNIRSEEDSGQDDSEDDSEEDNDNNETNKSSEKTIADIIISGNHFVAKDTILAKIPYKTGDIFNKNLSGTALRNLYSLGYFTDPLEIYQEDLGNDLINLHIVVKEKIKLSSVDYVGNKTLKATDIEKKIKLAEVSALDNEELQRYAYAIKRLYAEKSFHSVIVDSELRINADGTATAIFTINEGKKSVVKRVFFKGNSAITSKKLKTIIFTREDWLLSLIDKAGTYHPDAVEQDKYTLENFYQSNGYLAARVTNVEVVKNPKSYSFDITFTIEEGPLYTVTKVSAPGNDVLTETQLLARIPIRPGLLYSRDAIRQTIENLKTVWGEFGYIYADIEPNIQPDHEKQTVNIEFNSELGAKVFLNRIMIRGNKKTRDGVIRRRLLLDEGEILTTYKMDESKRLVSALGYFDQRDGVNWRVQRVQEDLADLELILREIKTGKLYAQISYGGVDKTNPSQLSSLKLGLGFSDRNFLGTGISYDVQASVSAQDKNLGLVITNPWMFDRPILGALSIFHKQTIYEDFRNVQPLPVESTTGGVLTAGFRAEHLGGLQLNYDLGIQDVRYKALPKAFFTSNVSPQIQNAYQFILDRQFQPGELFWINQTLQQDTRSNPIFPTRGCVWSLATKVGAGASSKFGFFKVDFDGVWYTPLINEFDLIFALHGHIGSISAFKNKTAPYRELYHIGGPTTVRGYEPGDIGPSIAGDSIGATKAFYFNAELIFPFTKDTGMKGRLFYDGGAGWNFLKHNSIDKALIQNNHFHYRHAVGFGIQMTSPQPIRIDVGFKLDRNKRRDEKPYEVTFSMSQDFW